MWSTVFFFGIEAVKYLTGRDRGCTAVAISVDSRTLVAHSSGFVQSRICADFIVVSRYGADARRYLFEKTISILVWKSMCIYSVHTDDRVRRHL